MNVYLSTVHDWYQIFTCDKDDVKDKDLTPLFALDF